MQTFINNLEQDISSIDEFVEELSMNEAQGFDVGTSKQTLLFQRSTLQIDLDFLLKPKIYEDKINIKKFKIPKDKINLVKIDTNGSELEVITSIMTLLKRDKPVLIIENNNI